MRLVDADKLRKDVLDLPNCYNGFSDTYDKAMIVDLVDEQPTVDHVKHGHWIMKPNGYGTCSNCHTCSLDIMGGVDCNYCPNCGAKMDEEVNENETY